MRAQSLSLITLLQRAKQSCELDTGNVVIWFEFQRLTEENENTTQNLPKKNKHRNCEKESKMNDVMIVLFNVMQIQMLLPPLFCPFE